MKYWLLGFVYCNFASPLAVLVSGAMTVANGQEAVTQRGILALPNDNRLTAALAFATKNHPPVPLKVGSWQQAIAQFQPVQANPESLVEPSTESSPPTPDTPAKPTKVEPRVLVNEMVISGIEGNLQEEAYNVIKTRPGKETTRSQLQEDVNAIFATGFFSSVDVKPEDTSSGVRVTFLVQPNPVLRKVVVAPAPEDVGKSLVPNQVVDKIFSEQYGKILNLHQLQEPITKLNQWYKDNGYDMAQVTDTKQVTPDGQVTIVVAEGVMEDVRVRFLNPEGEATDEKGQPIRGRIPDSIITREVQLKPGGVFNRQIAEKDLQRVFSLGLFDDVKLTFAPGTDPRRAVVFIDIIENTAQGLRQAAEQLWTQGTEESKKQAIAKLQEAVRLAHSEKDVVEEARVLDELGLKYNKREDYRQALDVYQRSLSIGQTSNAYRWQAYILFQIAQTYNFLDERERALDAYNRVLSLLQVIEEPSREISLFDRKIAKEQSSIGYGLARSSLKSTTMNITFDGPSKKSFPYLPYLLKVAVLINQSEIYRFLGEYQQALYSLNQVLPLMPTFVQHLTEISKDEDEDFSGQLLIQSIAIMPLMELGIIYAELDQSGQAFYYLNQVQDKLQTLQTLLSSNNEKNGSQSSTASRFISFINSVASVGIAKTDDRKWMADFADLMLKFTSELKNPQEKAYFLGFSGDFYVQAGETQKALDVFNQILQLPPTSQNRSQNSISLENHAFESVCRDWSLDLSQSCAIARSPQVGALNSIGQIQANLGKTQLALNAHNQALQISQAIQDREGQAETFYYLGKAYSNAKQYQLALEAYNRALSLWETLGSLWRESDTRFGIAVVERERGNFAQARSQIETAIAGSESRLPQTENQIPNNTSALTPSIYKSYISLTDYFSSKQNYYQFYIDLLMQQGYKQQALEASERSRVRGLQAMLKLTSNTDQSKVQASTNSRYAELDQPPQLAKIQQEILDDDTVLLEYALGEERSYLWLVTKTSLSTYELPDRATIEAAAREFYNYLTVPDLRVRSNKTAKAGMALSQMILGPVAGQLGQKRLLIVGDGFLQYLPFSTLPTPGAKTATLDINSVTNWEPLLVNHEIVSLPSASMLEVIRHNSSDLPQPTKTLAVLADPVFSPTDERLTRTLRKTNSPTEHVPSVSPDATNTPLNTEFTPIQPLYSRLRATAQEAKQILETLPASEKLEKMGFAASRQAAISSELGQYRILHFATHGILNTQNPERSGIVLSTFDRQGQLLPRSVLSTPDVFNLKLAADLVVLSGCRTGLGKEVKGEGLVGLTGGFMYAGAKRVLVSLWSVDDEATSELMVRFYRGMFKDKLSPAKALRSAQLSMWRDPQWQLPYYWAAFTLQGDWK